MNLKKVLKANPNNGLTKADIDNAARWFDENGSAAKAFEASLEATSVMREDILRIVAAMTAIMNGGLTREALIVLLQSKLPKARNGKPMAASTITDVLEAVMNLSAYVRTKPGADRSKLEG